MLLYLICIIRRPDWVCMRVGAGGTFSSVHSIKLAANLRREMQNVKRGRVQRRACRQQAPERGTRCPWAAVALRRCPVADRLIPARRSIRLLEATQGSCGEIPFLAFTLGSTMSPEGRVGWKHIWMDLAVPVKAVRTDSEVVKLQLRARPLRRKRQTLHPMADSTTAEGGKFPVRILAAVNALGNLPGECPDPDTWRREKMLPTPCQTSSSRPSGNACSPLPNIFLMSFPFSGH